VDGLSSTRTQNQRHSLKIVHDLESGAWHVGVRMSKGQRDGESNVAKQAGYWHRRVSVLGAYSIRV
jgi:hypothetical protein